MRRGVLGALLDVDRVVDAVARLDDGAQTTFLQDVVVGVPQRARRRAVGGVHIDRGHGLHQVDQRRGLFVDGPDHFVLQQRGQVVDQPAPQRLKRSLRFRR